MKKTITMCLLLAIVSIMTTGCNSCQSEKPKQEEQEKAVEIVVENTISADREFMFLTHGDGYKFYESCVLLKDYLDEDCDGAVSGVSNVFQYEENKEPFVVIRAHASNGKDSTDIKRGFWIEDNAMNDDEIKITYQQAFERAMHANIPKPHSRNCILRNPVGPAPCNPQWVFGNIYEQIWVDATTGEVRSSNPAFPEK